ncbi:hypothetical protein HDU98_009854 [Podochytrium sp. JEL0797]|nr:hypothetical protein HDU98_009854 [Podochytrium sp. JEL0797]
MVATNEDRSTSKTVHTPTALTAPSGGGEAVLPLTGIPFLLVFIGMLFASLMFSLDSSIISPALSAILIDLGRQELLPWAGSAYMLLYGKFAGIFGRKWVMVFALVVFEIGSLICALAKSMEVLILGRAISGIGGGGLLPLAYIIVADITSEKERGKFMGGVGAMMGMGNMLGPILGGWFTTDFDWRVCFWINIPIGVVTVTSVIMFLNEPKRIVSLKEQAKRVDVLGSVVLLAALMALDVPLQLGGSTWDWNSIQVIVLFCLFPILSAAFVYVEMRVAKEPLIPTEVFGNPMILAFVGISFCIGAMAFTGTYYISFLFEFIFGYSPIMAGVMSLPVFIMFIIVTIATGIAFSKTGHYGSFFLTSPFVWAAGTVMVSFLTKSSSFAQILVALVLMGFGSGLVLQMRISAFQVAAPSHLTPIATGLSTSATNIGGNVGIALIGTIINNLIVAKTSSFVELQQAIQALQALGYPASISQYLTLSEMLKHAAVADPAHAPLFLDAGDQLTEGVSQAFKFAFLSLLPFLAMMLALVPFIWQRKNSKVHVEEEVKVEGDL